MEDTIILVDENDRPIGEMGKLEAHQKGLLHRAFSIFIFNSKGELLLQKRALGKYHSGGLWTNTCCGHPRVGESTPEAARRRLKEEMGFDCELRQVHAFVYRTNFPNGLIEHEYDHVFVGTYDGEPHPDAAEAEDWKWIFVQELRDELKKNPDAYSYWLRSVFDELVQKLGV